MIQTGLVRRVRFFSTEPIWYFPSVLFAEHCTSLAQAYVQCRPLEVTTTARFRVRIVDRQRIDMAGHEPVDRVLLAHVRVKPADIERRQIDAGFPLIIHSAR